MKRATLPVKIVKPEIAMASLVVKENMDMIIGIISPPPPIPPTLASAKRIVMTTTPKNSLKYIGKMPLCLHTLDLQIM